MSQVVPKCLVKSNTSSSTDGKVQ